MVISEQEHKERYSKEIEKARQESQDAFQSWFNTSTNVEQAIVAGFWDFSFHILTDKVCELLDEPEEKIALEIGYGGGRILNAASHFFKEAVGVDVHAEENTVSEFLKSKHAGRFKLFRTDGASIPLEDNSIDFVYSFIVLQHLPSFAVFEKYLKESYRCLKRGGIAQLYFGRYSRLNLMDQLKHFKQGYKEITDAPVNHTSLVIRLGKAKSLARQIGFAVKDFGISYKGVPGGYPDNIGGQTYITLQK